MEGATFFVRLERTESGALLLGTGGQIRFV